MENLNFAPDPSNPFYTLLSFLLLFISLLITVYWLFFPFVVMTRLKMVRRELEKLNTEQEVSNAALLKAVKMLSSDKPGRSDS